MKPSMPDEDEPIQVDCHFCGRPIQPAGEIWLVPVNTRATGEPKERLSCADCYEPALRDYEREIDEQR